MELLCCRAKGKEPGLHPKDLRSIFKYRINDTYVTTINSLIKKIAACTAKRLLVWLSLSHDVFEKVENLGLRRFVSYKH